MPSRKALIGQASLAQGDQVGQEVDFVISFSILPLVPRIVNPFLLACTELTAFELLSWKDLKPERIRLLEIKADRAFSDRRTASLRSFD